MDYSTCSYQSLYNLCKTRNITYASYMNKQEMIEVLEQNDKDKSIITHKNAREKAYNKRLKKNIKFYSNNFKQFLKDRNILWESQLTKKICLNFY